MLQNELDTVPTSTPTKAPFAADPTLPSYSAFSPVTQAAPRSQALPPPSSQAYPVAQPIYPVAQPVTAFPVAPVVNPNGGVPQIPQAQPRVSFPVIPPATRPGAGPPLPSNRPSGPPQGTAPADPFASLVSLPARPPQQSLQQQQQQQHQAPPGWQTF